MGVRDDLAFQAAGGVVSGEGWVVDQVLEDEAEGAAAAAGPPFVEVLVVGFEAG